MAIIGGFEITENNKGEIKDLLEMARTRALTIIGMKLEKYAKARCVVGTPESTGKKGYRGGTLRNSITFEVNADKGEVSVGSNVEYAPYVELGTGPFFTPPPEWENFDVPTPSGIGHGYVTSRPFIKPAVVEHTEEYARITKAELQ